MTEYYSPDQLAVIFPYLEYVTPKWLVLGGPADANEALTARKRWPGISVLGVEPNQEAVAWQLENGWPSDCPLMVHALSDRMDQIVILVGESGKIRNASVDPDAVSENRGNIQCLFREVHTVTLDYLDLVYDLQDSIIWMDIEGSELAALQGAKRLIKSRQVLLWNIEMQNRIPHLMSGIPALLEPAGYVAVKEWNASDTCRDRIYLRDDLLPKRSD